MNFLDIYRRANCMQRVSFYGNIKIYVHLLFLRIWPLAFRYPSFALGVIHKVRTLRFHNFRLPPPCMCTYAFSLHPLPPSTSVRILFFGEDLTTLQNKLLYKAIGKCRIKTPRRVLVSSLNGYGNG